MAPVVPPVASGTRNPSLRSLLTKHKVLRRRGRGGERRDGVSDKGKGNDALTAAAPPPKQQLSILWSVEPSVHFSPILRIAEMFRAGTERTPGRKGQARDLTPFSFIRVIVLNYHHGSRMLFMKILAHLMPLQGLGTLVLHHAFMRHTLMHHNSF